MTFYPDLADYTYLSIDQDLLNVGWLRREYDFSQGEVTDGFIVAHAQLAMHHTVMIVRGVHECEFCEVESPLRLRIDTNGMPIPWREDEGRFPMSLGLGEVWAVGAGGEVYSALSLVLHYVQAHQCRPPDEFIEAAIATAAGERGIEGPFYAP